MARRSGGGTDAFSIKEVAGKLGISEKTVDRELAAGRLEAMRIGGRKVDRGGVISWTGGVVRVSKKQYEDYVRLRELEARGERRAA